MKANGFSDAAIKMLWDILLPFSDYAFNKAHSAAYGVLSYWTAYLKAHFPAEYMAALLTSVGDARDKLALYLNECRRMGIKVLPPDVNESIGYFAALLAEHTQEPVSLVPDRPEWAKRDKLAFEREMLGLYVSDHPLAGLETPLAKHASTTITELIGSDSTQDGDTVTIAGLVTSVQHRVARQSGNQYGMIQVEDFSGEITVMFMGKAYQEFAPGLKGDSIVVVRGRVSMRDDGMNLHAYSVFTPELGQGDDSGPVVISLPDIRATTDTISALGDVLIRHAGDTEVRLKLVKGRTARVFELPYPVQVTADLYGELKSLLGPNCLV